MKNKRKRVEGSDHLYRTKNGSIVNTDEAAYNAYKRKKEASFRKNETMTNLSSELNEAKAEIAELKDLIKTILESK